MIRRASPDVYTALGCVVPGEEPEHVYTGDDCKELEHQVYEKRHLREILVNIQLPIPLSITNIWSPGSSEYITLVEGNGQTRVWSGLGTSPYEPPSTPVLRMRQSAIGDIRFFFRPPLAKLNDLWLLAVCPGEPANASFKFRPRELDRKGSPRRLIVAAQKELRERVLNSLFH